MRSFCFDPHNIVVGSALRRALPYLLNERKLHCDPERPAELNDLVFGEISQVPSLPFNRMSLNRLERLYAHSDGVKLRSELMQPGPCIGVAGNRYAPPHLIGGLTNPITGQPNREIRGGEVADSLWGVNAIGYVNREADRKQRIRIKVHGVVVDHRGRSLNLSWFRETLRHTGEPSVREPHLIVVAGHSTNSGKTTCAWALVSALRKRKSAVTLEKKTGTACCRDWLRCYTDPKTGALENEGDEACFSPTELPARDFVDGVGIASDVSLGTTAFVSASVNYTRAFLDRARPDFHVIELADSISHASNVGLLCSRYFRQHVRTLVYAGVPTHEAMAHFLAYVKMLGYDRARVLLSGAVANEDQYGMARDEIRERLCLPVCRSAIRQNGRWIPEGDELTSAVLDHANSLRCKTVPKGLVMAGWLSKAY